MTSLCSDSSNDEARTFAPINSVEIDMAERQLANSQLGSLEYDPAPESGTIAHLRPSYGLFIDGKFTDSSSHEQFASINPANESTVATVAQASAADVDRAVVSARRAYDKVWSSTTGAERSKYLFRIARIIQERARELAVVETLDNGKPIRESRDVDIPLAAAHFFYYAALVRAPSHLVSRDRSFRGTSPC
jgi:aldehyde dehydrogenase (NAD+)